MKLMGLAAVAALVVGVLVSVWARPSDSDRTMPHGPTSGSTTSAATPSPTKPRATTVDAQEPGSGGLNIRYLGPDGQTKRLDVKDFPR